jgi:transketolase
MNDASKDQLINDLKGIALKIKQEIVKVAVYAHEGHCAPGLSMADIATALYFHRLRNDPKNPEWAERDRFILSKGHGCLALYCALYYRGYFDRETLYSFLQPNSGLGGHPVHGKVPGVELSTGSLGHGLAMSVGLAMAAKMDKEDFQIFTLIGDGENDEGIVWESALCAAHYKLDNLTCIVDRNNYQCDGFTRDVLNTDPLDEKWKSFGWEVKTCDGHNIKDLVNTLDQIPFATGKPSLVLARTVKGKGVSFMESSAEWHYRAPKEKELEQALAEIEASCEPCG